uniref:Si:ch211-140b10.6 n=1 Tax=Oryzias latipes TaxID=8090 RepID=A0A3P9I0H9_ORYLA
MAEDNELEKRAIEELLKETDRARVRAETMGPAGWLKCPLQSTNKRFLLNTLRSTGLQRRNDEQRTADSKTRDRLTHKSRDRRCDRSRTPPTDHRSNGRHKDHKHHTRSNRDKELDKDKNKSDRHRDNSRDRKHADGPNGDRKRSSS